MKTTLPKIQIAKPVTGAAYRGVATVAVIGNGIEIVVMARNLHELRAAFAWVLPAAPYDAKMPQKVLLTSDKQPK